MYVTAPSGGVQIFFPHCFPQSLGLFWPALPSLHLPTSSRHPLRSSKSDLRVNVCVSGRIQTSLGGTNSADGSPKASETCKQKQRAHRDIETYHRNKTRVAIGRAQFINQYHQKLMRGSFPPYVCYVTPPDRGDCLVQEGVTYIAPSRQWMPMDLKAHGHSSEI